MSKGSYWVPETKSGRKWLRETDGHDGDEAIGDLGGGGDACNDNDDVRIRRTRYQGDGGRVVACTQHTRLGQARAAGANSVAVLGVVQVAWGCSWFVM